MLRSVAATRSSEALLIARTFVLTALLVGVSSAQEVGDPSAGSGDPEPGGQPAPQVAQTPDARAQPTGSAEPPRQLHDLPPEEEPAARRLQDQSARALAFFREHLTGADVRSQAAPTWRPLREGLARGLVDDTPWRELLASAERDVLQLEGGVWPEDLQRWLALTDLLGAWERLGTVLIELRDQGVELHLDALCFGQDLRETLVLNLAPEQASALVSRFTSLTHGVLRRTQGGPWVGGGKRPFLYDESWVVADAYLDIVAAAYHAAVVSGQRAQAGFVLRDARSAVSARDAGRLPDLERRLRSVDEALLAAGVAPVGRAGASSADTPSAAER